MIPIGTRIKFTKTIYEPACGDHPAFIMCRCNELGIITGYAALNIPEWPWPYLVKWDAWTEAGFYISSEDFEEAK